MKKLLVVLVVFIVLVSGCADGLRVGDKWYTSYGVLNEHSKKCPEVEYEVCWGNVVWACILIETIVFPLYFFGFSIFEPVRLKEERNDKNNHP
jgi:hypothetical protein